MFPLWLAYSTVDSTCKTAWFHLKQYNIRCIEDLNTVGDNNFDEVIVLLQVYGFF